MKITRKFQKGGVFESFFTTYIPVLVSNPQTASSLTTSSKSESTKDELTKKDLLDMLKDVDGLPNEMNDIMSNLANVFQMSNLTGVDTSDLATTYISNLWKIKVASLNKKTYDEVVKNANKNGALSEPAISMNGNLIILNLDGTIGEIDLLQYAENPSAYNGRILTVSNLANMRAYSPELAYNPEVLNIINNGVGFEEFQDLINKAKASLGSTKYTEVSPLLQQALLGLQEIDNLTEDLKIELLKNIQDGTIKYSTESNSQQISNLLNYLTLALPDRVKTWAAIKMLNPNKEQATRRLIGEYLLGGSSTSNLKQVTESKTGKSKNAKGSSDDNSLATNPNMGYWAQVIAGIGGEDTTYNIVSKDVSALAPGKYYGTTPGLDDYKSLNLYFKDANNGYIIKNRNNITFGDNKLVNGDEIAVDPNGGAYVVTLPITPDGRVDFSILDKYNEISDNLISRGYKPDTNEYNIALALELKNNNLDYLIEGVTVNPRMFGRFLVLLGIGSSLTLVWKDNKKISLADVDSKFIIDSSNEDSLYDLLENVLSNDNLKYNLDNNWLNFGPFSNDKVYRGNIFIPLTTNVNSAMNADNNDTRRNKAYEFERDSLNVERRNKLNNLNSTGSDNL